MGKRCVYRGGAFNPLWVLAAAIGIGLWLVGTALGFRVLGGVFGIMALFCSTRLYTRVSYDGRLLRVAHGPLSPHRGKIEAANIESVSIAQFGWRDGLRGYGGFWKPVTVFGTGPGECVIIRLKRRAEVCLFKADQVVIFCDTPEGLVDALRNAPPSDEGAEARS
jgi:hypothetical protein